MTSSRWHLVEIWVNTRVQWTSCKRVLKHFLSSLRAVQTAVSHIVFPLPKATAPARHTTGRTDLVAALVHSELTQKPGMEMTFPNHAGSGKFSVYAHVYGGGGVHLRQVGPGEARRGQIGYNNTAFW